MTEKERRPTEVPAPAPREDYQQLFNDGKPPEMSKEGVDAPSWIRQVDEDHFLVKTRRGLFKVQEREWNVVERARKRAGTKDPGPFILSDTIVGHDGVAKTFGEMDINAWKGGTVMRLSAAMAIVYEVDDFLGI